MGEAGRTRRGYVQAPLRTASWATTPAAFNSRFARSTMDADPADSGLFARRRVVEADIVGVEEES